MRKLASIQRIDDLIPIENADNIVSANIMGWNVVVKKDEFQVGDRCVFFEIDSVLPPREWSSFLERNKYRIKTCKLRGALSQGLAMPLDILNGVNPKRKWWEKLIGRDGWSVGTDVTKYLGVVKHRGFDKRFGFKVGRRLGDFPSCVPKTDEIRVQSAMSLLKRMQGKEFYATVKCDGTSATFCRTTDGFFACSRNRTTARGDNVYWNMVQKYDLENNINEGFAIQGEIVGPGIQKNRMGLKEVDFLVFDVFDIKQGKRLDYNGLTEVCEKLKLKMVPLETVGVFNYTLPELLKMARGKYEGTKTHREGLVFRSLDRKISFKVINNDYLLKEEE